MTNSRISIREHSLQDIEAYCDWQTDPEVAKYLAWLPRTREESEASLLDAIEQQCATPRLRFFFAVVLRDTGEMIGDVGYTLTDYHTADCGWFLRRPFWRQGYGTEAIKLLIHYAFFQHGLRELTASCAAQNIASAKVMEASGFTLIRKSEDRRWYALRKEQ